jgi:hypothetical protein
MPRGALFVTGTKSLYFSGMTSKLEEMRGLFPFLSWIRLEIFYGKVTSRAVLLGQLRARQRTPEHGASNP